MNRLESLDWLRGLLALSIMLYHLTGWKLYAPGSDELLGRLGIYGVSMFFVLSGLAMAAGYAEYIRDTRSTTKFFVRRIFRIWPMLWLAVVAVTIGNVVIKGEAVNWPLVLMNLTTAFGFINPGAYINTGAWSIGNEMVYYALTPTLLAVFNRSLKLGNAAVLITFAVAVYFAFWVLSPNQTLATQWQDYINPFNNIFLYAAGVAIYYNTRTLVPSLKYVMLAMISSSALLVFYPASGDLIVIVTGVERLVFCLASVFIVFSFYKLNFRPHKWIGVPLAALGTATYGVYLLHPIVFTIVGLASRRIGLSLEPIETIAITMAFTIAVSLVLYEKLELPLIRIGKRLTAQESSDRNAQQSASLKKAPTR